MVKVKKITIEEVKQIKRNVKPSAKVQEYIELLKELKPGDALEINAKTEKERPQTIKNRITRLAKNLGMSQLEVKRVGEMVYLWIEAEK